MVDESKVLVIEDDESYRHDLDTVLGFLGEKTISVHSENWSEGVEALGRDALQIARVRHVAAEVVRVDGVADGRVVERVEDGPAPPSLGGDGGRTMPHL